MCLSSAVALNFRPQVSHCCSSWYTAASGEAARILSSKDAYKGDQSKSIKDVSKKVSNLIIHNDWNVILIDADFGTRDDYFLLKFKLVGIIIVVIVTIIIQVLWLLLYNIVKMVILNGVNHHAAGRQQLWKRKKGVLSSNI